ncbi:hypothetical protein V8G54_014437 [Vigna mungo]|uniref:Uncharacterized protein n=1 Tax=Vigna mungo TaxID=3915 RepID=A0AAQ3NK10_VIGMU
MAANYHTHTPHILDFTKYRGEQPSDTKVEQLLDEVEKYALSRNLYWDIWGMISRFRRYWSRKASIESFNGSSQDNVTINQVIEDLKEEEVVVQRDELSVKQAFDGDDPRLEERVGPDYRERTVGLTNRKQTTYLWKPLSSEAIVEKLQEFLNGKGKSGVEKDRKQDQQASHLLKEKVWFDQESPRDLCALRC